MGKYILVGVAALPSAAVVVMLARVGERASAAAAAALVLLPVGMAVLIELRTRRD